jgi:hypothetical protein
MPDLLRTGSDWLARQLKAHCSRTVIYRRGEQLVSVVAVIGRSQFEAVSEDGIVTRFESRDFLIATLDLVLNGTKIEPRRGDRVVEEANGQVHEYEVSAPEQENVYRYCDPFRELMRIHTKRVGEA